MVSLARQAGTGLDAMEMLTLQLGEWGKDVLKFHAMLYAIGLSNEQVARVMDEDLYVAEELRNSPQVVDKVLLIQTSLGYSAEKRIACAVHGALDVKIKLLGSRDEKIAAATANDILDRNLGKPMQTVQSINTNLNITSDPKELDSRVSQLNQRLALLEDKKRKLAGQLS